MEELKAHQKNIQYLTKEEGVEPTQEKPKGDGMLLPVGTTYITANHVSNEELYK